MTLADKVTLARLGLAPIAVIGYLAAPTSGMLCFWICGVVCGLAELTDYLDGRIARMRHEISDFGKLADPFCDVLYRMLIFFAFLLPAGGTGYTEPWGRDLPAWVQLVLLQPTYALPNGTTATACAPWLAVVLMAMREFVAGALRAMTATQGLVLAARTSGKVKAWFQGLAITLVCALPGLTFHQATWHLPVMAAAIWLCTLLSVGSMVEYLWVNRHVLRGLAVRTGDEPSAQR
ncbi:CDP-diacylglycerol--glycerol-3-phosphate 3-phosphatidyltransferase [Planctomycetota bacterium]|nr:CDP-diacylglycerol--glycerol-3-phosphate 3-phosphatidyltransferase [Planctomycetota bacterium]